MENYQKLNKQIQSTKIPTLKIENKFVISCEDKAKIFNDLFSKQCKPNINESTLPPFSSLTNSFLSNITFHDNDILTLLRNIDPNKSNGPDMITGRMIRLCDDSIVLPLKIIYTNILKTSKFPDSWKLANVTPVYKKNDNESFFHF